MDEAGATATDSPSSRLLQSRRSSLFDVPVYVKPRPCGSSVTSFAYEPKSEDDYTYACKRPLVQYENTYDTDPPCLFEAERVTPIIEKVLKTTLTGMEYDATTCSSLCRTLASEIKALVKALNFDRYKIVCSVMIGEVKYQDVRLASRCVWDVERDTFASASYHNASLFATGLIYASYYE